MGLSPVVALKSFFRRIKVIKLLTRCENYSSHFMLIPQFIYSSRHFVIFTCMQLLRIAGHNADNVNNRSKYKNFNG